MCNWQYFSSTDTWVPPHQLFCTAQAAVSRLAYPWRMQKCELINKGSSVSLKCYSFFPWKWNILTISNPNYQNLETK